MKTLISIAGPTASGKTAVAVELANRLHVPVISADSRQVYRELNIGTAKPTAEEMKGVPHFLLDEVNPDEPFSAGMFADRVAAIAAEWFEKNDVLLMAGGSTLYLSAVWEGLDQIPDVPLEIREAVNRDLETRGLPFLLEELQQCDPVLFERIDRNNPRRVTRGVEVFRASGKPLSFFQQGKRRILDGVRQIKIGLFPGMEKLTEAIDRRVEKMMSQGLLAEVQHLYYQYGPQVQALQTVGYAELIAHLQGDYTLLEAVRRIQHNTRQYARRQMTWFRRYEDIHWFEAHQVEEIFAFLQEKLSEK